MRALRRLGMTVIVLAVLAAGLDYGLRAWAGLWVGDRVEEGLHLSKRPSVSFGGLLFIPQVMRGRIDSATVEADAFAVRGIQFSHARLTLDDVTFQSSRLLLHHRGSVEVGGGGGVLSMTGPELELVLRAAGADVSIRLSGGKIKVSGGGVSQEVAATASVEDGSLVLRSAEGAPLVVRVPLPSLGPGIRYGSVAVHGGEAQLTVKVERARFSG